MTANQSRLLGVVLLLSAVVVVAHLVRSSDPADTVADDKVVQEALAKKYELEQAYAKSRARLENGAYIVRSKRISDSEEIETIVIPEGHTEELDTRCIVYKNLELRSSSINCVGIMFRQAAPPS